MTRKYNHLFFDIDRTLWDYEANSHDTLEDIFNNYSLKNYNITFSNFYDCFQNHNDILWKRFMDGEIKKEYLRDERFVFTLLNLGIDNRQLALKMSYDYISISPEKTKLFPGVIKTLKYLKDKYHLHVITNGFNEVQFKKLKNSGIEHFFNRIITSDNAGYSKPHKNIFHYALSSVNAKKSESLMIGDNWEVDILGAMMFGIDQVYFNPKCFEHEKKATFEIKSIDELIRLL